MTQTFCLETTVSIALSASVNTTTTRAAIEPPNIAPNVESATVEGKDEPVEDAVTSLMRKDSRRRTLGATGCLPAFMQGAACGSGNSLTGVFCNCRRLSGKIGQVAAPEDGR